jgi:hypothetical protein
LRGDEAIEDEGLPDEISGADEGKKAGDKKGKTNGSKEKSTDA